MYILASQLRNLPIMSLQTGQPIAKVERPILSRQNLEAMALRCVVPHQKEMRVALMRDVRQFATDCVIVDSAADLEDPREIVRLKEAAASNFDPIGKQVVNESGQRLGRVEDYTINLKTSMLQKLYVHQSLLKSILFNSLVIDRTQIIDVTDRQFTVRDAAVHEPSLTPNPLPQPQK